MYNSTKFIYFVFLIISMEYRVQELLEISQALGVLKYVNQKQITNFKLAYEPYQSTQQVYEQLGQYQLLWQKLFFKVSEDREFIKKAFSAIAQRDDMVKQLFCIFQKLKQAKIQDGIAFSRCDYYFNQQEVPKLTQYNIMSVGMQSHMEKFQEAKKLTDFQNKDLFAPCETLHKFVQLIDFYLTKKQLRGLILFVVQKVESNLFDQKRFQIQLIKKGYKIKRASYQELYENIEVIANGDLYFQKQLVSIVYYRSGYKLNQFAIKGDIQLGWRIKEQIQLSNAISIPSVTFQLINQKRIQTQLKKPQVLRRFLTEEQASKIQKTFVQEWQFESMTNEGFQQLITKMQGSPESYILKPNLQGGNNNIFGVKALEKLKNISKEEAQLYILMEKIISKSYPNKIMNGTAYDQINCLYEISRYGAFCWIDGQLVKNVSGGFLIRAKPEHENEGGIMSGVGAIVPWKFIKQ